MLDITQDERQVSLSSSLKAKICTPFVRMFSQFFLPNSVNVRHVISTEVQQCADICRQTQWRLVHALRLLHRHWVVTSCRDDTAYGRDVGCTASHGSQLTHLCIAHTYTHSCVIAQFNGKQQFLDPKPLNSLSSDWVWLIMSAMQPTCQKWWLY